MIGAHAFEFGPFLLVPERQLLMRGESSVRIGGRALDLLTALVERPGELVSKQDLMSRAWPTTTVEECNLKVNIAALRRALGDTAGGGPYIATVAGRGYRFVAPVERPAAPGPRGGPQKNDPQALADIDPAGGWTRVRLVGLPNAECAPPVADRVEIVGYGIVIDGEITVRLDEAVVLLGPGAKRGRSRLPANLAAGRCRMLFIQVDGD
jgi:DNA-binding winged helix-turn-helix (wHTH) protein